MPQYNEKMFWDNTRAEDTPNACWLWAGYITDKGYGQLSYRGRYWRTQRLAYAFTYGAFDSRLMVLHLCGNRSCINPSHLYLGTAKDNAQDSLNDGTFHQGERHTNAKLSNLEVVKIRRLLGAGLSRRGIARQYGVASSTIDRIILGKTWKHVA